MENRSFDHYLGWLASDDEYLEHGRKRYGPGFFVDGQTQQTYRDPLGRPVQTRPASSYRIEAVETRGCTYRAPGHDWTAGRIQRDHGFLAPGSGNDEFALAYYGADDLRVYAALAASVHDLRSLACVVAGSDLPEPAVPVDRAVGR